MIVTEDEKCFAIKIHLSRKRCLLPVCGRRGKICHGNYILTDKFESPGKPVGGSDRQVFVTASNILIDGTLSLEFFGTLIRYFRSTFENYLAESTVLKKRSLLCLHE